MNLAASLRDIAAERGIDLDAIRPDESPPPANAVIVWHDAIYRLGLHDGAGAPDYSVSQLFALAWGI